MMTIKEECIALSHQFRLGYHIESCLQLPALLERVLATLPAESSNDVSTIVSALLNCQERHDWLGLADWLEGELISLFQ